MERILPGHLKALPSPDDQNNPVIGQHLQEVGKLHHRRCSHRQGNQARAPRRHDLQHIQQAHKAIFVEVLGQPQVPGWVRYSIQTMPQCSRNAPSRSHGSPTGRVQHDGLSSAILEPQTKGGFRTKGQESIWMVWSTSTAGLGHARSLATERRRHEGPPAPRRSGSRTRHPRGWIGTTS